uniref:Uncharacterized protein n=1 Tax=Anguilla anguilla TaxID=7936 RepID=A0A0E9UYQ2_ANGAN
MYKETLPSYRRWVVRCTVCDPRSL